MRTTRLYYPGDLVCGETVQLNTEASGHLIRVLRTKIDSAVTLFNGDGHDYHCTTLDDNARKTLLSVNSRSATDRESNLNITLIQGLSRHERMEYSIQKSVELGVNRIIPVICKRSNTRLSGDRQNKKLAHWNKVIISACEQSGRSVIPELTELSDLESIAALLKPDSLKFALNPTADTSLKKIYHSEDADSIKYVEIFIGPEGGLADEEISFLKNSRFTDISFGPRILRTETAGPAVISALQALWGDY